jgi:hypothetical protein
MDGLKQPAQITQDKASVPRQLDHLGGEIDKLNESILALKCRLEPLMPPETPEICGEDCAKPQQESSMMDSVISLTSRIRSMNSSVCRVMDDIQI